MRAHDQYKYGQLQYCFRFVRCYAYGFAKLKLLTRVYDIGTCADDQCTIIVYTAPTNRVHGTRIRLSTRN